MINRKRMQLFLMVFSVAVILLSFAPSTYAQAFTYSGQVVAINNTHVTVTIQAGPNEHRTFYVADFAVVMKCDKFVSLSDIKVGDNIKVSYYEAADKKIADFFTLVPGTLKQC